MVASPITSLGLAFAWPAVSGVITDISVDRKRGGIAGVWTLFMDFAYIIGPMFGGLIAVFSEDVSSIFLVTGMVVIVSILPVASLCKNK